MARPGKRTEIYVARGAETLGPYSPEEAAGLIQDGSLSAHDLAAREGDIGWVALSTLLTSAKALAALDQTAPPSGGKQRLFAGLAVGLLVVLVAAAALSLRGRHPAAPAGLPVAAPGPTLIPPVATLRPTPALKPPAPPLVVTTRLSSPVPMAAETPRSSLAAATGVPKQAASPSPVEVAVASPSPEMAPSPPVGRDCRLDGTVSLKFVGGDSTRFPDVRVAAYALDALQPSLDRRNAQTQWELDRLEPQLQAAAAEKAAREKAAESALQASLQSSANDPLRGALGFAAQQARVDLGTAAADYHYFLDQRAEALDGQPYYRSLPAPLAEAQTDAAGEYCLKLPSGGRYAVAACVRQGGITGTHAHYWLVKIEVPDGGTRLLPLSEDNMASSDSEQSLLRTAD